MSTPVPGLAQRQADARHARGRLTARERLALLLDPGSMTELAAGAVPDALGDGVITAQGGLAHMPLSLVGYTPDMPVSGFWF